MLSSSKMKIFLERVREQFDYVILDTPPVITVTDAQILSTMADGVILVVSSGEADRDAAIKAKELLLNVNAKILGVVLNKIDIKSRSGYGYSITIIMEKVKKGKRKNDRRSLPYYT